jgi:CMP-N-acetylneuraminic acid synthetase
VGVNVLALIPARGGSKGIPRKNIQLLAGKPLIGWTIDAAKQASCINRIVVTTEDDEIAGVARELGADVPFMRPAELAADETPGIAPVLHAIEQLPEFDWVLLLQPTSPLRTHADIEAIWYLCRDRGASSAVSVTEVAKHPSWVYTRDDRGRIQTFIAGRPDVTRRQDLPAAYALNGAL